MELHGVLAHFLHKTLSKTTHTVLVHTSKSLCFTHPLFIAASSFAEQASTIPNTFIITSYNHVFLR